MKQNHFLYLFFCLIAAGAPFMLVNASRKDQAGKMKHYSPLLQRKTSLANNGEWEVVSNNFKLLTDNIDKNPAGAKSIMSLVALYIKEARVTGCYDYYHNAAFDLITPVLEKDPKNFEPLSYKATILLSQHRFEQGKQVAEQLRTLYPH